MAITSRRAIRVVDLSMPGEREKRNVHLLRVEGAVLIDVTTQKPLSAAELENIERTGVIKDIAKMPPEDARRLLREGGNGVHNGTIHNATGEDPTMTMALAAKSGGIVEIDLLVRADPSKRRNGTTYNVSGLESGTVLGKF